MSISPVSPNMAANAYSSLKNIGGSEQTLNVAKNGFAQNDPKFEANDGVSFSDYLRNNIKSSVQSLKSGEELSAKAVTGEANLTDVVQAVTSAEVTLQTVVAVRDRMISAYQEIMRMPI